MVLKIHSDFYLHQYLKIDRRLNLLLYLNDDWKDEYGGHLELWDKTMTICDKKINLNSIIYVYFQLTTVVFMDIQSQLNVQMKNLENQ